VFFMDVAYLLMIGVSRKYHFSSFSIPGLTLPVMGLKKGDCKVLFYPPSVEC
jgi:hypothetical protein